MLAAVVRTFDIQLPIIVREKLLHQSHAALTDVVHAQAAVVGVQAETYRDKWFIMVLMLNMNMNT